MLPSLKQLITGCAAGATHIGVLVIVQLMAEPATGVMA
jgi:hypothetical protein